MNHMKCSKQVAKIENSNENVRQLTYWKCIIVVVARVECRNGNQLSITCEVGVFRGEGNFLQCEHREISFRVAKLIDSNGGAGDALEVSKCN